MTVLLGLALKAIDRRSLVLPSTLAPLLSFSASVFDGPFTRLAMGSRSFGLFGEGSSSFLNHLAQTKTPSGQRYLVHCASAYVFPKEPPKANAIIPCLCLEGEDGSSPSRQARSWQVVNGCGVSPLVVVSGIVKQTGVVVDR